MEKRLMTLAAGVLLSTGMALAQSHISGKVTSAEDGLPVMGASVKVVGSKTVGAITDADGNFKIDAPAGSKIEVSYIGMLPKTVKATGKMFIVLDTDSKALDEVMVVAYGTAKKSAFTGSAAVLKSDDIAKVQVQNPVNALVGKAAGVQINTASGQPGSNPTILIRGIKSINAGTSPLYVVDGVPFDGDMNDINPQDVESMTVLKDAASAALYGARGANGVIMITTKKGRVNTSSITFDAKWGSNHRATPDYEYVKSPAKHYELWYQALKNFAMNEGGMDNYAAYQWANTNMIAENPRNAYSLQYNVYNLPAGENLIGLDGKLNPNATLGNVVNGNYLTPDDWSDAAYRSALRQEYSLTATGGNDRSTFYGSANYLDNEGIAHNSDYKRFTARLRADYQMRSWLKLGGNFNYTHFNSNSLSEDGSSASSGNVFALTTVAPIYPLYIRDAEGNIMYNSSAKIKSYDYGYKDNAGLLRPYMSQANPLSDSYLNVNNSEGNTFNAMGSAEVRFLKDFKFTSTNSVFMTEVRGTSTTNPFFGQYATENGVVYKSHSRSWSYNYQQLLKWNHMYGKHDIDVMVGHEYYRLRSYALTGSRSGLFDPFGQELAGAIKVGSANSDVSDYNTEGYFGNAQYNYAQKYFGSVSYRRDASSRFDKDHRWGDFWSFGASWLISKESWFNAPWVDELKIKASYGEQGNDQIGNYRYMTLYGIVNNDYSTGVIPSSLGNKNITWESNANFNAGVEFSLFNGRLSGDAEFFINKTTDMLSYRPIAPSYGFGGKYANVGDMKNTGIEVSLDGVIMKTKDFSWTARVNLTHYKNEITRLADESKTMVVDGVNGYSSGNYYYGEGEPRFTYRLPKYAGVDDNTGVALYWKDVLDENGNVVGQEKTANYNAATYHLCGTALPDVYGGFGTSLAYKGFDFSVDFAYQLGGQVYDSSYAAAMGNSVGHIFHKDILNAWTPEHHTNIPRLQYKDSYPTATSDRFLTSASYLSLNNIQLGYTFPREWINKLMLTNLRLYVTADNVWVWSKRQGLDPRQSITGAVTSAYYASMRTISGGITVSF